MSQQLISHSPDLKQLRDEGYDIAVKAGHLLVRDVPYVNFGKETKHGVLVMKLMLAGDVATMPDNHVAYFIGEHPCNENGAEITRIKSSSTPQKLAEDLTVDHTFSAKPLPHGNYKDYYDKVKTYDAIISGHAQVINPKLTARTFPVVIPDEEDNSVFNYIDTASSRAGINVITQKLERKKIAIVGLGGTGSYVLDLITKTPVQEIHLFDADIFSQHNAFRSPGAPSIEELRAKPSKVAHLKSTYSKMHRGIVAHEYHLGTDKLEELRGIDFAFLCFDRGDMKELIIGKLEELNIPFVDVGMGLYVSNDSLGGILRTTTSTPEKRDHIHDSNRIPFSNGDGNNEYVNNIQIADLNALNATLAVIKWKKLCGFYLDLDREHHCTYTLNGNALINEDRYETQNENPT